MSIGSGCTAQGLALVPGVADFQGEGLIGLETLKLEISELVRCRGSGVLPFKLDRRVKGALLLVLEHHSARNKARTRK